MKLKKIKAKLCMLWLKFNASWYEARQMQKRIDEAHAENLRRHGPYWKF